MKTFPCLVGAFCLLAAPLAVASGADTYVDAPEPGEAFPHFFARITHGALFQGIQLESPVSAKFQEAFLKRIWRPQWEGRLEKVQKSIKAQGVDIWADWYHATAPLAILAPTSESRAELARALARTEGEDSSCAKKCRSFDRLAGENWDRISTAERQAFAKAMVREARLFGGERLVDFLARAHGGSKAEAERALARSELRLLNSADFEKAVRKIGWDGPIYFRGVTAPDPDDASRRWILLNDDLMRKMTPFPSPLIRALEYVGILTHEMSHVFQDQVAEGLGIDLKIGSPEGILLIEGEAEFLAEEALLRAGEAQGYPSAVALFAGEQGVEIVNRPGQETQGNLFPYTIGLPFAASLFDLTPEDPSREKLRVGILKTIGGERTLKQLLDAL